MHRRLRELMNEHNEQHPFAMDGTGGLIDGLCVRPSTPWSLKALIGLEDAD
ncbi:hypothetical protein IOQ59_19000 [Pontibacterium sp. N1Y112]|uniref:Uncharacterized protein n=1 Tax=Pontibacterium sinense TaxID=2781979 RepID=A0A8J7FD83_9GAMM|nr:hypothetical protein [Pontibacterium sinense]MBE9399355.1 hypothetical protein [Pontibacterium sinense]